MTKRAKFYVEAVIGRGRKVVAYAVNDSVGGLVSEHASYEVNDKQSAEVALHLANAHRDDLNNGVS